MNWVDTQRAVSRLWGEGRLASAIEQLDAYLLRASEVEGPQVHSFKALLLKEQGKFDEALGELQRAIAISPERGQGRYHAKLACGFVLDEAGRGDEALAAYRSAMEVLLGTGEDTGAHALHEVLQHTQGGALSPADRALCEQTAREAWAFQGLAGSPSATDLAGTAARLFSAYWKRAPES